MITLVPAARPATRPVALTVATVGLADTQGAVTAAVADPVSCVVAPAQTASVPEMVGTALTVTEAVFVQPLPLV